MLNPSPSRRCLGKKSVMLALVVYESMSGSTRELAEAIAAGLRFSLDVRMCRADEVGTVNSRGAVLLVAGGPTEEQPASGAPGQDAKPRAEDLIASLALDRSGLMPGVRAWFDELVAVPAFFAAFDTRADIPVLPTGAASVRIGRELRLRGSTPVVPPESFLLTRFDGLKSGEVKRANVWGELVAEAARRARPRTPTETPK
jgi:hypothetical protein